ncbi:MAG TPA: hypothetical protein VHZ51_08920, partial [Ktedonobacteraceae bacterium]|nr:hypothetical protein [Ktedonobacteraceae bacterium]
MQRNKNALQTLHHDNLFCKLRSASWALLRVSRTIAEKKAEGNGNNSIELPAAIKNLITGSDFWVIAKTNRYKKLIREGHLRDLLELANIALTKNNPANWFAKVCSVKAWERTLDFLKKLYLVRKETEAVLSRIGKGVEKLVYKHAWAGKSVERYAIAAQKIGKDR